MTAADHIDTAISLMAAAKAYVTSPRYVNEAVAAISDALHSMERAREMAEADRRELEACRAVSPKAVQK